MPLKLTLRVFLSPGILRGLSTSMASTVTSPDWSLDTLLAKSRAFVVQQCAPTVQRARIDPSTCRVLFFDSYVVKFNQSDILNEADTQLFVYAAFNDSSNAPRVPMVYDSFSWNNCQYLVMERVHLPTVQDWITSATNETDQQCRFETACQEVANALRSLFSLPAPAGAEIGLIEGAYARTQSAEICATSGRILHPFFGFSAAPFRYTGAPALERHINKILTYRAGRAPRLKVNIADEPLVMVQCDIAPENFSIDPETHEVTMIDFSRVSALPHSFVTFTVYSFSNKFTEGVAKYLGWEKSVNSRAMSAASKLYCQMSDGRLGLDNDGYLSKRVSYV